jgi:hypothetical protein
MTSKRNEMNACEQVNGEVYLCDEDFICETFYAKEVCAIEKEENEQDSEYVPCMVMQVQYVQGKEMEKPSMMILFDPGSTRSYVKQQILPAGAMLRLHLEELLATTLSGESRTNRSMELRNIIFPEFTRSLRLEKCEMWVLDSASQCPVRCYYRTRFATRTKKGYLLVGQH